MLFDLSIFDLFELLMLVAAEDHSSIDLFSYIVALKIEEDHVLISN
jgi:hypothetical protein